MKKAKKVIQNYLIIDTLEEYENQYEILLARHTTQKKLYVLKKLSIKQGNNQALYEGLLNEVKLLKLLNHQNIVRCFRMLKTSNNIYIAFSYFEGSTLSQLLEEGPKVLTFAQKESIAKQLCLVLSEMQKSAIAHLNINTDNIIVSPQGVIMIRDFLYAMEIPEEGEVQVLRRVPKSSFISPETRRGIACLQADIFSVGKVFEKMDFKKCKKDTNTMDNSKRMEQLLCLVESMTAKDRNERLLLTDVYQTLFPNKKKVKRLRSLSQSGMASSRLSRASSISSVSSSKSQFGAKQIYTEILMKILRHRNMSWFLMRLFQRILSFKLGSESTVMLGMLIMKKSTKLLSNLGKYLHYGKNDIGIEINSKEQSRFFKTTDYHKVCQLVDKQIAFQKQQFEAAVQIVYVNNAALLRRNDFSREFHEEQTNQNFFQKCIREFLSEAMKGELSDDAVFDLYLMSLIVYFHGVEQFFKQRILFDPINFDQQIFIKKAKDMPREKILEYIRDNLDPKIVEI